MTVAYFCMEYALEESLPIFAGGLGVLAGDLVLETGNQKPEARDGRSDAGNQIDLVAIGLYYHEKVATPEGAGFSKIPQKVWVDLGEKEVAVEVWQKKYGETSVYLLSTNSVENPNGDRDVTRSLYGPDHETMLKQQLVLGIGGVKLLKILGIKPTVYHLNEGHTAFTLLGIATEMLGQMSLPLAQRLEVVKSSVVATKHTILAEAGLHLPEDVLAPVMDRFLKDNNMKIEDLFTLGLDSNHPGFFSTTQLMLKFARKASGVSAAHIKVEKSIHPTSPLIDITNGINVLRWDGCNNDPDLWADHNKNRGNLVNYVNVKTGLHLDPNILTVVWARRFAAYKRPGLLFSDLAWLKKVVENSDRPVQFIISGKVTETDEAGKKLALDIENWAKSTEFLGRIAYLPDYSLQLAKILVAGADVWLNTPELGKEACGTSGMKAGLNGALMLSTNDGWMAEEDFTGMGWIIPAENSADGLYKLLETEVGPLFYQKDQKGVPEEWVERMRKTRELILAKYTAGRMLSDYQKLLYLVS